MGAGAADVAVGYGRVKACQLLDIWQYVSWEEISFQRLLTVQFRAMWLERFWLFPTVRGLPHKDRNDDDDVRGKIGFDNLSIMGTDVAINPSVECCLPPFPG